MTKRVKILEKTFNVHGDDDYLREIGAIEPVPRTFRFLQRNVAEAGVRNLEIFNFALGSSSGTALMQGHPSNFACSFIADHYTIPRSDHFTYEVPVKRLDDSFP